MLIDVDDTPAILRRHHILTAYRPLHKSTLYYLSTAFIPNNEMLNFWTHFLPAIYILSNYLYPEIISSNGPQFNLFILYTGIIILFICSSFSHLLHSKCYSSHVYWLLIDFFGISYFSICTGLQRFLNSKSQGLWYDIGYVPCLLIASLGLQFLCTSYLFVFKNFWRGRIPIKIISSLIVALWIYVPLLERYFDKTLSTEDVALRLHTKAFGWLLLSGVFMGSKIPERFVHGKFDIIGYSHQLFHCCIFMVTWNLCEGAYIDNKITSKITVSSNMKEIFISVMLICILVIYHLIIRIMMKKTYSEKLDYSSSEFVFVNNCCFYTQCHVPTKNKKD
uniref:Progestin and adipoQ receptor family member 3-like n=1 Tax=Parastrongyloides trichosuri TaxID=131310 RepID=A0A0N4ZTK5_PARTI